MTSNENTIQSSDNPSLTAGDHNDTTSNSMETDNHQVDSINNKSPEENSLPTDHQSTASDKINENAGENPVSNDTHQTSSTVSCDDEINHDNNSACNQEEKMDCEVLNKSPSSTDSSVDNQQSVSVAPDDVTIQLSNENSATDPSGTTNNDVSTADSPPIQDSSKEKLPPFHHINIPKEKIWLYPQFILDETSSNGYRIRKPNEFEDEIPVPSTNPADVDVIDRIQGSILGMAIGDALGAHVEFRPHQYLIAHPVTDFTPGGTWNLSRGQFTDDTSMALCLANSLITRRGYSAYDQLVRYKWWFYYGYLSSTGTCFDIGNATRQSLVEFCQRQQFYQKERNIDEATLDFTEESSAILTGFNVHCSHDGVAGNGALMRLAPVPLFFHRNPHEAVKLSGESGILTHGDSTVYDACRYYGALIVGALHKCNKETLLHSEFYSQNALWFDNQPLHADIKLICEGSFKKSGGYNDGIRGGGYIVKALEAALWAFWSTDNFRDGVLAAVNLGDDTDTTAAIYGQLAGAFYGYKQLPADWKDGVCAKKYLLRTSEWIYYEGENCSRKPNESSSSIQSNDQLKVTNIEETKDRIDDEVTNETTTKTEFESSSESANVERKCATLDSTMTGVEHTASVDNDPQTKSEEMK